MTCLGITGAKQLQQAATEVIIGLLPLHLHFEAEARAGIYRLYCSDQWKPKSEGSGYAYMTQGLNKEPILQMETDRMILRHVHDKPFTVRFPDRSERKDGFQLDRKGQLIWYTDGSKTNKGCMVMAQGGSLASDLGNTQQYSRHTCMPFRHGATENLHRNY
jgi:hypothetical protein